MNKYHPMYKYIKKYLPHEKEGFKTSKRVYNKKKRDRGTIITPPLNIKRKLKNYQVYVRYDSGVEEITHKIDLKVI